MVVFKTIVFKNYIFYKTRRLLTIVSDDPSLTIVIDEHSFTIVNNDPSEETDLKELSSF